MKTTLRIARLELSILFYSPVAWLVLAVFTIQTGLSYTEAFDRILVFVLNGAKVPDITENVFTGFEAPWRHVQENLYLYMPLLTMGLMSREISSGSIKLLLSSPVRLSSIVLGKFIAMAAYGLILVSVLLLFVFAGAYSIQSMDIGLVLSGVIGLYLLICAYASIGLFMSSLTSYQIVAAIGTLAVLAALNFIGGMAQWIPFVRGITGVLSISGRCTQFIAGLINSKDIFYFLIVITLFLGLTILKLQAARESRTGWVYAGRYALFVSALFMAGYISSRQALRVYYDMTANKNQTISKNGQALLQKLTKPLSVTTYINIFDRYAYNYFPADGNPDFGKLEPYARFKRGLKMKNLYYYDSSLSTYDGFNSDPKVPLPEKARKLAESIDMDLNLLLPPAALKQIINLKPEENRIVKVWEYDGKKGITRMFDDNWVHPGEQEIMAVLKGLITPGPTIALLTGNDERSADKSGDRDYQFITRKPGFRHSLINQGFKVNEVLLPGQDIPRDITGLVIADPKSPFTPEELANLKRYIDEGGNMVIAGEPGRQSLLSPLLSSLGVRPAEGILIRESRNYAPDFLLAGLSAQSATYTKGFQSLQEDSLKISMPGAFGLEYEHNGPFKTDPIVITDEKNTWITSIKVNLDSAKIGYHPELGDKKKQVALVLALTRKIGGKEQRIIVSGDADFMNNQELNRYNPQTGNLKLATEIFRWIGNEEFPMDTSLPKKSDFTLKINRDTEFIIKIILVVFVPLLLAAGGGTLLLRRKRK